MYSGSDPNEATVPYRLTRGTDLRCQWTCCVSLNSETRTVVFI